MSYVFHRDTRADMPIVVRGDGSLSDEELEKLPPRTPLV